MYDLKTQVVVLGGGPGGYSAAFRAADLGLQVVLIEQHENLGGVCLNVGCIPSKTLLHLAKILDETKKSSDYGVAFSEPKIDLNKLNLWKNNIIKRIAAGLKSLSCRRGNLKIISGVGKFISLKQLEVFSGKEQVLVSFDYAIIATGSSNVTPSFLPNDPRIMDSSGALTLTHIPKELLVIGGGVIGLEMATVYSSFGSSVTIVELTDRLLPWVDFDLVKSFTQYNAKRFFQILYKTKVLKVEPKNDGLWVEFEDTNPLISAKRFDNILVAIGRKPNTNNLGELGVSLDNKGFIIADDQMRTSIENIFAIGDVVGNPMLAHKAVWEGRLVAEIIVGNAHPVLENKIKLIPNVAYTDPEIATVGLNEEMARQRGVSYTKAVFPWLANGRALTLGRQEGVTKLLFDPDSKKILGGSILGVNAGELISEIALAIKLGATADSIAHVIHPHPTLSETTMTVSEVFLKTATDI